MQGCFSTVFLLCSLTGVVRSADMTAAFLRDYLSNVYPYTSVNSLNSLTMNPYSSSMLTSMNPYSMLSTNPMMGMTGAGVMGPYQSIYGMVDPYGMGSLGMSPFRGMNLGMGGMSGLGMGLGGLNKGYNSLAGLGGLGGLNTMNMMGLQGLGGMSGLTGLGGMNGLGMNTLGGLGGLGGLSGLGVSPFGVGMKREKESTLSGRQRLW